MLLPHWQDAGLGGHQHRCAGDPHPHLAPEKAKTARRVRLRAVLEWAVAMELRINNPCDRIGPVLGPQRDLVEHLQALPHREVATAIRTVRA